MAYKYDIKVSLFRSRLDNGWTPEEAAGVVKRHRKDKIYNAFGFRGTLDSISNEFGIDIGSLSYRVKNGENVNDIVSESISRNKSII